MTPIPLWILTGFLGAGKTTLLNALLRQPALAERRLALLINEFGHLGIDGARIAAGPHPRHELNRGSLFCRCLEADLIRTLTTIAEHDAPELVLVEATGVADPCDLEQMLAGTPLRDRFAVQAGICLVDARHFPVVAPMMRAARRQVQWADGLIVNKQDLVGEHDLAQLQRLLRELNPTAPQHVTRQGVLPPGWVEALRHAPRSRPPATAPPDPVFSASFCWHHAIDRAALLAALAPLRPYLLRLKGYADFGAGPVFLELVDGELREEPAPEQPPGHCRLVVIAWHIGQRALHDALEPLGRGA